MSFIQSIPEPLRTQFRISIIEQMTIAGIDPKKLRRVRREYDADANRTKFRFQFADNAGWGDLLAELPGKW